MIINGLLDFGNDTNYLVTYRLHPHETMPATAIENLFGINQQRLRQWVQRGYVPRPHVWHGIGFYNGYAVLAHVIKKETA